VITAVDPYVSNPFRVLGLQSNASCKEAGRTADRLLKWIELGEIPQVDDLLPYLGVLRRDREQIKKASKEIEDPRARINSELYWPSPESSVFETCRDLLRVGQYRELIAHCEKAVADGFAGRQNGKTSDPRLDACLACHYLAVFYHSAAIATSRAGGSSQKPPVDWDHAFKYWTLVVQDEVFWRHVASRTRVLDDPRVNPSYVEQLRRELPSALLQVNVSRAVASVERGQSDEFALNCAIIKKAKFGSDRERALKEVALPLQTRFEKILHEIQPAMSETAIRREVPTTAQSNVEGSERSFDPQKLVAYLASIEESIGAKLVPIGRLIRAAGLDQGEAGVDILDGIAYAFRSTSLAFNNYGGMPRASLRLTTAAKEFARSTECKERLDGDYQVLQFLSLQKEAGELAGASRYRESLTKLEEARKFASSDDERQTIDEWIEAAKKRIALEGVKKIDSPPSMFTFNGIGTKLYGKRNYDANTQSYIATLYFTFIFFPVLPLGSYRVRYVGGNQYQFLGKVPLKWTAFVAPAIVAVVIAFFMLQDSTDTGPSWPTQYTPSNPVGTVTSGPSSSPDKERLGQWIEQERTRLESERTELDSEGTLIEVERQSLNQRVDELNSGSPSQAEIDDYETSRAQFNARVRTYNAKLARHQTSVQSFNAQVSRYNSMP